MKNASPCSNMPARTSIFYVYLSNPRRRVPRVSQHFVSKDKLAKIPFAGQRNVRAVSRITSQFSNQRHFTTSICISVGIAAGREKIPRDAILFDNRFDVSTGSISNGRDSHLTYPLADQTNVLIHGAINNIPSDIFIEYCSVDRLRAREKRFQKQ